MTPSEFQTLTDKYSVAPEKLAMNSHGDAVALYAGWSGPWGRDIAMFPPGMIVDEPLYLVERPRDPFAPRIAVRSAGLRGGRVALAVRCNESCRVRASLAPRSPKRAKAGAAVRSNAVTVRRGRSGRLSVALTRSERARLGRLVRRGRRALVTVRVRAEDSWGNQRTVRRVIPAKRLLR